MVASSIKRGMAGRNDMVREEGREEWKLKGREREREWERGGGGEREEI